MLRETYRGVKLSARACKGRDYGKSLGYVNGQPFGPWRESPESLMRSMRGTVDAAIREPERYANYWQPYATAPGR